MLTLMETDALFFSAGLDQERNKKRHTRSFDRESAIGVWIKAPFILFFFAPGFHLDEDEHGGAGKRGKGKSWISGAPRVVGVS